MKRTTRTVVGLLALVSILAVPTRDARAQTPAQRAEQLKRISLGERPGSPLSPPADSTGPPPGPVHSIAEWEESEGIILDNYWRNADTVYEMQLDNLVYIQVNDVAARDVWIDFLNNNSIPLTNIRFLMIPCNVGSMRDCAPWFIWDGNSEMGIVNNTCWGGALPLDDQVPRKFAQRWGIPYYEPAPKIFCEGGNFYPNGYGVAYCSSFVYADNKNKSKALTDTLFRDWLGIEVLRTPAPSSIWHHDTWGKPANPETMIVVQWPETHANHPVGEGMAAYYETLQSPWGGPFEIHRLPMFEFYLPGYGWTFKPYMNSVISNEKVFVPITNSPDDLIALAVFEAAFTGYEVVGVGYNNSPWEGSLHCATKNIMRRDPIRIYQLPPRDSEDTASDHRVTAEVIPPNGFNLLAGHPALLWTDTGGAPFTTLVMSPTGQPNEYEALIPAQPQQTTVSFYVEARDDGGRAATYPMVAPDGMMSLEVRADAEAPVLSRFIPTRSAAAGQWPPSVRTLCKDDMATPEVRVEYAINGVPQPDAILPREEMCYWYEGELAGSVSPGDLVTYRIIGTDNAASPNSASLPVLGEVCCPVVASEDAVGIVNLGSRSYTAPFLREALGGLDIPHHCYAEWPADLDAHDVWFIVLGTFAYNHVLSSDEANEIVAALQAGKSIYLEGGDTWCHDPEKGTLQPWFGVQAVKRGGSLPKVKGVAGQLMQDIDVSYRKECEQICIDRITKVSPAAVVFMDNKNKGLAVMYDAGGYRSIASGFPLGGLRDEAWPETRKEVLVRYLDFFGLRRPQLMATGTATPGAQVPVRIEGGPGNPFVLLASWAEDHAQVPGYGTLRLKKSEMYIVERGNFPANGAIEVMVAIPSDPTLVGRELHLQAVAGPAIAPGVAALTNRDILTIR